MINEPDRDVLTQYRIEQAKEAIELTRFLIESNHLTVAVNRIYYGEYYAITALAIKNQFETSKHIQLIGWFNKEFIATGILDKKYGKILRNAFRSRTKGDYDVFVTFEKEEVEEMHTDMIDFIQAIEKLINKSPIPNK